MISKIKNGIARMESSLVRGRHKPAMDTDGDGEEHRCLNCGTLFVGNFCPNCGQSAKVKRLSISQGVMDLVSIFTNFENGFVHTCLELCYRPGYMMRDYIEGHRKEYVKPIPLLFLLGTVLLLLHLALYRTGMSEGITIVSDDVMEASDNMRILEIIETVGRWMLENRSLSMLMMVTLMVLPNRLCFNWVDRAKRLNVSEHFFVMAFLGCQMTMVHIVEMPIEYWKHQEVLMGSGMLPVIIMTINHKQLFGIGWWRSLKLTLTSWVLTIGLGLLVLILAAGIGIAIFGD